jgi:hypothetical protein
VIYFVTYNEGRHSVAMLLADWGRGRLKDVRRLDYSELFHKRRLPLGSYIFTGLEHLSSRELEYAARAWKGLRSANDKVLLCNHPLRVLRRYELLRALNEKGINGFNVYRLGEFRQPKHFPVFLRHANDHAGPRTELLKNSNELQRAKDSLLEQCICPDDWIITEFFEARGHDGLFRKYGAFLVNGQIIPRHLHISRDWMIKRSDPETVAKVKEEEWTYVHDNPHADELREIFAIAKTDYGRIDYTIHDGGIRVFEINTNPQILNPGQSRDPARIRVKQLFADRFISALREMESIEHPARKIRIDFGRPPLLKRRPRFVEAMVRLTNRIGLKRLEPYIYRGLVRFRRLWR